MKKTENISLAGYSFTIEIDAYAELDKYLSDIRAAFTSDGNAEEIASDIEERIAELLSEKCRNGMVVNIGMIDAIKEQIGDPKSMAQDEAPDVEQKSDAQKADDQKSQQVKKKIYRNVDERVFGGVCSGLGAYFGIDKVFIRIIFLIIFFITFVSTVEDADGPWFLFTLLAYIALWIAMPAARTVEQKCEMKGKPIKLEGWKDFDLKAELNDAATSPAGQTFKRVGGVFLGLLLLTSGFGMFLGSIILPAVPELLTNLYQEHVMEWGTPTNSVEHFAYVLTTDPTMWILLITTAVVMSLWFVYNGIMLLFNLKAPKWRPGMVLFISWIFCLMALAAWTVKMTAEFLPTITL